MSGIRQHFIPQFLQKGFRIPSNGKTVRCWVYEHGRAPRSANIADVGLERHFYAVEAETELDDKISMAERDIYAPLIERLRQEQLDGETISLIPKLLAHFEMRSRHVRQNMDVVFEECTTQLMGYLSDPQILGLLLEDHLTPGSEIFNNALAQHNISYDQLQLILSAQGTTFKDLLGPLINIFAAGITSALPAFRSQITEMVKKAHVRILTGSVSPAARAARLASLKYTVRAFAPGNLPLGDSIVLFHVKGERAFKSFLEKDDELIHVVLPLSSQQYLLGAVEDSGEELTYDLAEQIARCSIKHFIASSEKMADLEEQIGSNAHWISQAEIDALLSEVVQSMMPKSLR